MTDDTRWRPKVNTEAEKGPPTSPPPPLYEAEKRPPPLSLPPSEAPFSASRLFTYEYTQSTQTPSKIRGTGELVLPSVHRTVYSQKPFEAL